MTEQEIREEKQRFLLTDWSPPFELAFILHIASLVERETVEKCAEIARQGGEIPGIGSVSGYFAAKGIEVNILALLPKEGK